MAFTLPTFNLTISIWRQGGGGGAYAAPDVATNCNLTPGRRVEHVILSPGIVVATNQMEVLLPKLTDIRAVWNGLSSDMVEVPAGSKRFYLVYAVDDIGKGFPNEHRYAIITYKSQGGLVFGFNAPVPLP